MRYFPYFSNFIHPMPPHFIIAPCLHHYSFYSIYDQNNNNYHIQNNNNNDNKFASTSTSKTKEPAVSSDSSFSVSRQLNADSGSSGTYICVRDISALTDIQPSTSTSRIGVTVADGNTMFSSHTGRLTLPSGHSLLAYIFEDLNTSLLSISDLVDIGYEVTYSKAKVDFMIENKSVFEGQRDLRTGLWMVDFSIFKSSKITKSPNSKVAWSTVIAPALGNRVEYPTKRAAPAVEVNSAKEFVSYWHASFGYPSKSTFVRNILNKNISIDGLTASSVRRNFVPSVYTAMGAPGCN